MAPTGRLVQLFSLLLIPLFLVATRAGQSDGQRPPCGLTPDRHLQRLNVKLPAVEIPDNQTTYVCWSKQIQLNSNGPFQAVGFQPLVDRADLVHHMILFGCPSIDNKFTGSKPHHCSGSDSQCRTIVAQWSRGVQGAICPPPNAGIPLSITATPSLSLQVHYENSLARNGIIDTSGFRIYYTKANRNDDLGNIQIGQNDLEIPPGHFLHAQRGGCSSECTKSWLTQPIFLTRAHVHMHRLGVGAVLEIYRDGLLESKVLEDKAYDYNQPPVHHFSRPVKIMPGDEIQLTCFYNSKDGLRQRNRTVFWGEGSEGEMCYAFLGYFPRVKGFDQCIQFDTFDICSPTGFSALGECIFEGFTRIFETGLSGEVIKHCQEDRAVSSTGNVAEGKLCSLECEKATNEITEHPCMQDRLGKQARRIYLPTVKQWTKVRDILEQRARLCTNH